MKSILLGSALSALALAVIPAASAQVTMDKSRGVVTIAPTVEKTVPAVVSIRVTSRKSGYQTPLSNNPFFRDMFPEGAPSQPRSREAVSAGSGVIIDARKGHILTNHHVIADADEVVITLDDGRKFDAELVGSDEKTDIALLKIDAVRLTELKFADSEDVKVGDYVIAIGNPFGVGLTVTTGIVSALDRFGLSADKYENFIQTDASINPGNSGGALVNSKGELIGINTAIISRSGTSAGVGFAVPVDMAEKVMEQLLEHGEVRRGRIGVSIQNVTPELAEALDLDVTKGALISEVTEGSPADLAGLQSGDVVTAFNRDPVESSRDLRNAVGFVPLGETSKITFERDGRSKTVSIDIEAIPKSSSTSSSRNKDDGEEDMSSDAFRGAVLMDIPDRLNPSGGNEGVLVQRVEPGSAAAEAGLRRGDIIRGVKRKAISNLDDFTDMTQFDDDVIALTVQRGRQQIFVAVDGT